MLYPAAEKIGSIFSRCASYEVLFMKHTKAVYDNKGVKRDKSYQREKKETASQNCEFPFYFRSENCPEVVDNEIKM
jgi:hypothetical protein